jgi:hypothetical protein
MHVLEVGKRHPTLKAGVPQGAFFNWSAVGAELLLSLDRPTSAEAADVRRGAAELALAVVPPAVWLLFRIGQSFPWSEAPYCVHLLPADQRPDLSAFPSPESRLLLHVVLVDSASAVLRAQRACSLSPGFSVALADAVRAQAAGPWTDRTAYDLDLATAYRRYPMSTGLLALATHRTDAGA